MNGTGPSRIVRSAVALAVAALATAAVAQVPFTPIAAPAKPSGVNNAWPTQNANGPTGAAYQVNYPYPGQCLADPLNAALFPMLLPCPAGAGSFATVSTRTGGDWATGATESGAPVPFVVLNPLIANSIPPAGTLPTPKFVWPLLNPPDYAPDTTTFAGADYYEIGVHEAWGFQAVADAGLFPSVSTAYPGKGYSVPDGMQWTGLVCTSPVTVGCTCPPDASLTFQAKYCTLTVNGSKRIPQGAPLFTPVWGVGQINNGGGPVTQVLSSGQTPLFTAGTASSWSLNNYVATWPSISIRGTRGRPVVVKWVNEFPTNHVFCPHPEAADWPCAIDRTFMGVKARVDPALPIIRDADGKLLPDFPPDGVNRFGSPQQPDNSWVTHFHGGEIPPSTDGFAEKWIGSKVTASAYKNEFVSPPFENPSGIMLKRPTAHFDVYTYPMVQEESTVWFHDHTLGKTHHNVIAGPAGFFPIKEPGKHGGVGNGNTGVCPTGYASCSTEYTWLDPVTEPRSSLGIPLYDLFLAVQDRSFSDDGSINFSNALGQALPAPAKKVPLPIGFSPLTNGVNPQVHPTWVPEFFGDHVLVNGVLWPRHPTAAGWYRIRFAEGSDSRCYTVGFQVPIPGLVPVPTAGTKPITNLPFYVIANDQGYLQKPVLAPVNQFTMCPGERYEILVNFGALPAGGLPTVYMTNSAPAPFPAGITPFAAASPYKDMNVLMRFDVGDALAPPPVRTCGAVGAAASSSWNPNWAQTDMMTAIGNGTACMPANPTLLPPDPNFKDLRPIPAGTVVRQMYLNERLDGVTLAPMGMQLNGVPFEYKVTETPRKGTKEVWQFINLTVDSHPIHPHLVSHQIVSRQTFNVGAYKALLCGSSTCQPGPAPGGEMQVVPDVTKSLTGAPVPVTAGSVEGGRKDATQAPPGMVTTIIADFTPRWNDVGTPNAPGTAGCTLPPSVLGTGTDTTNTCAAPYVYEDVTTGPYVWHCHINSHEDSEMMRTSLVLPSQP